MVFDLYAPWTIENLAFDQGRTLTRTERAYFGLNVFAQEAVLRYGDVFICASERQRDLWLGALLALGRLDHLAYRHDPSLRTLIEVVPFGIDPELPTPGRAVRGVVPGLDEGAEIQLWPGGIWNWFDPLSVIRAVAELRADRKNLWLVFLGVRHPNPGVPEMEMTRRAVELAEEVGLAGSGVHFNDAWVPYAERGAWLLEADLGVSAHFDDLETRFAYRTRLLDCFWAGLPVVATEGDTLADLVSERRLGRTVAPGDIAGWKAALASLLDDDAARGHARTELERVRAELAWPRVVEPLAGLLEHPGRHGRRSRGSNAAYAARRIEYALASRGVVGALRRVGSIAAAQARQRIGTVRRRARRLPSTPQDHE
jgi:glycosyltransferase involved in cell wall biosynthesis